MVSKTTSDQMGSLVQKMESANEVMTTRRTTVTGITQSLLATWDGDASGKFDEAMISWDTCAVDLQDAFRRMTEATAEAGKIQLQTNETTTDSASQMQSIMAETLAPMRL